MCLIWTWFVHWTAWEELEGNVLFAWIFTRKLLMSSRWGGGEWTRNEGSKASDGVNGRTNERTISLQSKGRRRPNVRVLNYAFVFSLRPSIRCNRGNCTRESISVCRGWSDLMRRRERISRNQRKMNNSEKQKLTQSSAATKWEFCFHLGYFQVASYF